MKKWIALMLAAAMLAALTACGSAAQSAPAASDAAPSSASSDAAAPAEPASSEATEPEEDVDAGEIMGQVDGYTYDNHYFGVSATFAEPWYVLNGEEAAALNDAAMEQLSEEEAYQQLVETVQNGGQAFDMSALLLNDSEYTDNVNALVQDIGVSFEILGAAAEEMMLEETKSFYNDPDSAIQMGFTNATVSDSECTLSGVTHPALLLRYEQEDGSAAYIYQTVIVKGHYIWVLTVTTFGEDRSQEVLAHFE
ncbi:MAG: hypothetical protein IJ751_04320 [Oscillospiraceae bacterium]|nr:hypothetical protein [Oscillospiraceae bacterium]